MRVTYTSTAAAAAIASALRASLLASGPPLSISTTESGSGFEQDLELLRACTLPDEFAYDEGSSEVRVRVRVHAEPDIWLVFAAPSALVSVSGVSAPRAVVAELESVLRAHARSQSQEHVETPLFDLLTTAQAHLADHPPAPPAPQPDQERERERAQEREREREPWAMARVILWTHHLKAASKRRDLAAWAAELDVWALVKLGHPGFLCFEGTADDVDEIVRRVRALQWHALALRTDERFLSPHTDRGAAIRACPLAPPGAQSQSQSESGAGKTLRTACHEVESIKDLVHTLQQAGIQHDSLVHTLHLRTAKT